MNSKRPILLARPLGGLNDCLCQIEYARKLAQKHRRLLAIQTETGTPGLGHRWGAKFEESFDLVDSSNFLRLDEFERHHFDARLIHPEFFRKSGLPSSKSLSEITGGEIHNFRLSDAPLSQFQVVVHEDWGGGLTSASLLPHIKMSEKLVELSATLLSKINPEALGIHFRNNDYKSNFVQLLEKIDEMPKGQELLLATDDLSALLAVKKSRPNVKITLASSLVKSLDHEISPIDSAILDLIMLSSCKELLIIPLISVDGSEAPKFSGFGRLAKHIWAVRVFSTQGLAGLVSRRQPFQGIGGHSSSVLNFAYLVLHALPRIISQGMRKAGFYGQLAALEK
jgi:hypothetical protein